ncbi:hypothetical protein C5167_027476 [Papaver somniferum]|nr:hypothetical protein C5167_027476 [Papaver somniferum]
MDISGCRYLGFRTRIRLTGGGLRDPLEDETKSSPRKLPKGTHRSSLVTPEEIALIMHRSSISVQEVAGMVLNPVTGKWVLSDDISIYFIAYGTKNNL